MSSSYLSAIVQTNPEKATENEITLSDDILTPELLAQKGLKEERFRIDRRKLEEMIQVTTGNGNTESAEDFFQKVMIETATQILWPSKLKIGAKSKKDPHVKIIGIPENVQLAKSKILQILDTKKNRVTLKMDVSHSDHSYIIGKGGFKIQQVKEETGCHIHFPDSNRNAAAEKSNQVSIAGEADRVEVARAKIRELLPFVFMFELPGGVNVNPGDETGPPLQHIQQTYSFNVAFKAISPGRVLIVVRGCNRLLARLRQGLVLLMEYITGSRTIPVMGFMKTEIAVQHHQFVMGIGSSNLHTIMSKTGATIAFPDSLRNGQENVSTRQIYANGSTPVSAFSLGTAGPQILQSRSSVLIQGSFDSVCLAWQELLKCLPLVLMFDLEGQDVDSMLINRLMETHSISIMLRPKIRENTKSVILRGAEKDSRILFQVRKEILGLQEATSLDANTSSESIPVSTFAGSDMSCDSNEGKTLTLVESLSMLTNIVQQNPQILGLLSTLSASSGVGNPQHVANHNGISVPMQFSTVPLNPVTPVTPTTPVYNKGIWDGNHYMQSVYNYPETSSGQSSRQQSNTNSPNGSGDDDSGIFVTSHSRSQRNGRSSLPDSSASSTSSLSDENIDGRADYPPRFKNTAVRDLLSESNSNYFGASYETRKIAAAKAMKEEVDGTRFPNSSWCGQGFSKSMPDFVLKNLQQRDNSSVFENFHIEEPVTPCTKQVRINLPDSSSFFPRSAKSPQVPSPFAVSNYYESLSQSSAKLHGITNLQHLLSLYELEEYSDLFALHEIDLEFFLELSETDLQHLNIGYAARKKMLAAIMALKDRKDQAYQLFRAAPGAERPFFKNLC